MPPRQSKAPPIYQRPSSHQLLTGANKNPKTASVPSPETFPGPVVLPGDYLDDDPHYPPQSFRSWKRDKDRNEVTEARGVIYVAPPPEVKEEIGFVTGWTRPVGTGGQAQYNSKDATRANKGVTGVRAQSKRKRIDRPIATATPHPEMNDVVDYLAAFYHPVPIKLLPASTLTFSAWIEDSKAKSRSKHTSQNPRYIALNTPTESIRIRTRLAPSSSTDSGPGPLFPDQLNLDDLLDAALSILPSDAYAILCLVAHDIYESEDDDFACGRAYGASRIAVVSMARYDPGLDGAQGLNEIRPWPASHFGEHGTIDAAPPPATKKRKSATTSQVAGTSTSMSQKDLGQEPSQQALTPLRAAFAHHTPTPHPSSDYLFRICRTASHELGHCFGIDHCVYYACSMQGTTSLAEDMRQPPYLCPVDLGKVITATSTGAQSVERTEAERIRERYGAMIRVCQRFAGRFRQGDEESRGPWKAFGAWIEGRVQELDNEDDD